MSLVSCRSDVDRKINDAASLIKTRPDSALTILNNISYSDLDDDMTLAKFALLKGWAHGDTGYSFATDTLFQRAADIYLSIGDTVRWGMLLQVEAVRLHSIGDVAGAYAMLDSVLVVTTDTSRMRDLHVARLRLAIAEADDEKILSSSDWLVRYWPHDKTRYSLIKLGALLCLNRTEEAMALEDSIINSNFVLTKDSESYPSFVRDYVQYLKFLPNRAKDALTLFENTFPDFRSYSPEDKYILSQLKLAAGDPEGAKKILETIDYASLQDKYEYLIGLNLMNGLVKYSSARELPSEELLSIPRRIEYRQRVETGDRMLALDTVNMLDRQNYQLHLNRQRLWIIILSLTVLLLAVGFVAYIMIRRRRERLAEAEERIDTLNSMLDEVMIRAEETSDRRTLLRKTLLQQMGILKTFAEAPTAHNQDALKKISNVGKEGEKIDALVDWEHFYSMIDELYDGFHSKTACNYPELSEKELQIICLLKSSFSTKEIGVLTSQSSATIYVRKTSIRKKLSTPENGDFIAQLDGIFGVENDH
ncbi:MAG: hypothetical protein K2N48_11840 [Muribaculaceae bacterium]|nr:hypothetical protein [Muribaculaceae bacterium]